jgi:hypothetical protein
MAFVMSGSRLEKVQIRKTAGMAKSSGLIQQKSGAPVKGRGRRFRRAPVDTPAARLTIPINLYA